MTSFLNISTGDRIQVILLNVSGQSSHLVFIKSMFSNSQIMSDCEYIEQHHEEFFLSIIKFTVS